MNEAGSRASRRRRIILASAIAFAALLNVLYPGLTPWVSDEPEFIRQAFLANKSGTLAQQILVGNFGVRYHPLPIWLYQVGLLVTTDLVWLVFLKSCISVGVTMLGLYWFIRNTGYRPVVLLFPLLSPFQYMMHRVLWDNCMLVPLAAVFLGAVSAFFKERSTRSLLAVTASGIAMLYIHPMSVPTLAAGGVAILIVAWRNVVGNRSRLTAALGLALVLSLPYAWHLHGELHHVAHVTESTVEKPSFVVAVTRLVNNMDYWEFFRYHQLFVHASDQGRLVTTVLAPLTGCVLVALWALGMVTGIRQVLARRRSGGDWDVRSALLLFAGLGMAFQLLMFLLADHPALYHYYNASWICVLVAVAGGADQLVRSKKIWVRNGIAALLVPSFLLLAMTIWHISQNGGNRYWRYGPTLTQQIRVVQDVLSAPPRTRAQFSYEINHYQWFENAFLTLYLIYQERLPRPQEHTEGRIRICYANAGHSGRICVVREGEQTRLPNRR